MIFGAAVAASNDLSFHLGKVPFIKDVHTDFGPALFALGSGLQFITFQLRSHPLPSQGNVLYGCSANVDLQSEVKLPNSL